VAWRGRKPSNAPSLGPHISGEVGIIVGSRTDSATGRTEHGVATYGGIAVGNRLSSLPPQPADGPYAIEARLSRMALPSGTADRPVAGYLYFPKAAKKPKGAYGLEYSLGGTRKELPLALK